MDKLVLKLTWNCQEPQLARASLVAQSVKNLPARQETWVRLLGLGRVPEERNGNPLQYSCLENPMDREARQATVHGVTRVGHDHHQQPAKTLLKKKKHRAGGGHTPQLQNLLQKNNNQKILILTLGYMRRSMGQN